MTSANDNDQHKMVASLGDLPQSIQPPRDLWASIESRIAAETQSAQQKAPKAPRLGARNPATLRWLAVAAMISMLAVGMWIGRTLLPAPGAGLTAHNPPPAATTDGSGQVKDGQANNGQMSVRAALEGDGAFQAAYFADPKLLRTRADLLKSAEEKFNSLPPDSRQKVIASLNTIHQSMKDLEAALGKDPSNALLQELLVNTYQDEMRVLTTVHEAGTTGEGI